MRTKYLLLFATVWLALALYSQKPTDMALGEWRLLLPYNHPISVSASPEKVYFATRFGIVARDKTDGSLSFFDRVNSLSDADIKFIKYNTNADLLFVVYQNSNMDVITPDGSSANLPYILDKQIPADKTIYDLLFSNGRTYVATGFGLVSIMDNSLDVEFSTFTNQAVKGVTVADQKIFITLPDGLYSIDRQAPGIQDFQNWEPVTAGLPTSGNYSYIGTISDQMLAIGISNQLFAYHLDSQQLDTIFGGTNQHLVKLTQEGHGLVATFYCDGPGAWDDCDGRLISLHPDGTIDTLEPPNLYRPRDGIRDGDLIWVCDDWYPFRRILADGSYEDVFRVNSPLTEKAHTITSHDDTLYIVAGGWSQTKSYPYAVNGDGYFTQDLRTGQWGYLNRINYPILQDSFADLNFLDIAFHPTNGKKYIASFGGGLIEWDGAQFKFFNNYNTPLRPEPGYARRVGIIDLAFDEDGNLWMTNYNAPKPLAVYQKDGSWQNFDIGAGNRLVNRLLIDDYGYKWIIIVGRGLLVYSNGEDINNVFDDQYKLFSTANSEIQDNRINDFAKDQDGTIWVATDKGVITFECGGDVFEDYCTGSRRISTLDGFGAYLLEDEKVTSVAVDAANRKWFGTTNGVFVLSPSGQDVLAHFDSKNSPLPADLIVSLYVDNQTGIAYMGTPFGVAAYRSDAVKGGLLHKDEVYAFPNPVRPGYNGPIAISGLAQKAKVKITDVEGRLVYETEALGGQAVWDGKNYNGQEVTSGVYLVFSASFNDFSVDAAVAKIVILR